MMLELFDQDLRNEPAAAFFVKDEVVEVAFADADGELLSREGFNRYRKGDALIIGSSGDRWSVSRDRFDAKYVATDRPGYYGARPVPVLAMQIMEPFMARRSTNGDMLQGNAYDWFLQYAPGDYGVIENARFQQVYRKIESPVE